MNSILGLGYRAKQRRKRELAAWEEAHNTTGVISQDIGANGSAYVELFDLDDEGDHVDLAPAPRDGSGYHRTKGTY